MERKTVRPLAACALGLAAALGSADVAAAAEDFYKNKTVTLIVGFSPGGGYDVYARLLAQHIGTHVPGRPATIVKNMPGASSLKAVSYLAATARNDSRAMVLFNPGLILASLTEPDRVKIDFRQMKFLGSITGEVRVCYFSSKSGIRNMSDLLNREQTIMGATSTSATSYILGSLLRTQFGAKIKHVTGYPGSAEQRIALERGEIEGMCGSYTSVPSEWIKDGTVTPVVRFGKTTIDGMPPLPYAVDLAEGTERKQVLRLVLASGEFGRPAVMGPEVPEEHVKMMRVAFERTMKDKAFRDEADRQKREILGPMTGEEVEAVIKELYDTPKSVVAKADAATSPAANDEKVKLGLVKASGKITRTEKDYRNVSFESSGKTLATSISASRTAVTIDGKKADRKAIRTGMVCEFTYLGPGSESKQIDCKSR